MDEFDRPYKLYAKVNKENLVEELQGCKFQVWEDYIVVAEYIGDTIKTPAMWKLFDENECHNYKVIEGEMVECTNVEKENELASRPLPEPTQVELLEQSVTDLEISDIRKDIQLTDMEIAIIKLGGDL